MTETVCPGCGHHGPGEDGPAHPYMLASPRCWRLFNALMAREYATPQLMPTHYLGVDAYAAQHPGDVSDRRARQSVWIHLAGLHAVMRACRESAYRYDLLRRLAAARDDFPPPPKHEPFSLVAADISSDQPTEDHVAAMRGWADATLEAYEKATPDLAAQLRALG